MKRSFILAAGMLVAAMAMAGQGRYMEPEKFLDDAFNGAAAVPVVVWVTPEIRSAIESVLGRRFPMLRVRYWEADGTTAWIFDEIGKTEPITIGVSVKDRRVSMVRVLEFRESRGWEVRYPFFTDQFSGVALAATGGIDHRIDGITGATLSVAAVNRVVQLALMLDGRVAGIENEFTARAY